MLEEKGQNSMDDYLPNEIIFNSKFKNETADLILSGPNNASKQLVIEFFRGIISCHQASIAKVSKDSDQS